MLGKLVKVDLRDIWKHEAIDYTNWLAKDENLALLGEEIGINMHLVEKEASVGKFSADILAEEENTGRKIVIENQLEQTDHDHFGKLFTYGSGYEAGILIWICREVREEHRNAIDWLNERTDNSLNIFVLRMEVWKIADSQPAPKFQIVCSPNDWAKTVKNTASGSKLSTTNMLQIEFWTNFNTFIQENHGQLRLRKPQAQHWYDISIDGISSSQAYISLTVSFNRDFIRCEFYIPNNKELFHKLSQHKTEIEKELGYGLTWQELPKAKASSIHIRKDNIKLKDGQTWVDAHEWLFEHTNKFIEVFPKYCSM